MEHYAPFHITIHMTKLNPHSRLASFYRYFYLTKTVPNNLCNYCWGLLLAFIITPLIWPAMAINRLGRKIRLVENTHDHYENGEFVGVRTTRFYDKAYHPLPTLGGVILTFILCFIGATMGLFIQMIGIHHFSNNTNPLLVFLTFYLIGIVSVIIGIFIFQICIRISRFLSRNKIPLTEDDKENKREALFAADYAKRQYKLANPSFIKILWRSIIAFKEKNCPLIEWDYNHGKIKTK